MHAHPSVIGSVVRKDWLLLWPLIVIVNVSLFLNSDLSQTLFSFKGVHGLASIVAPLSCMVFIFAVIHQDASVSVSHDWLAKPIAPLKMVLAKVLLIAAVLYAPAISMDFVNELLEGHSLAEAVLKATAFRGDVFAAVLVILMIGALTSTLLQAIGTLAAVFLISIVLDFVAQRMQGVNESNFVVGTFWLLLAPMIYLPWILVGPILWLQYRQRRTLLAWGILGGAIALSILPFLFSKEIFQIHVKYQSEPSVPNIELALNQECFPRIVLGPDENDSAGKDVVGGVRLSPGLWDEESRGKAGVNAIGFATTVIAKGAPKDWRALVGSASASYVDDNGKLLNTLVIASPQKTWRAGADIVSGAAHFWLVPRTAFDNASKESNRSSSKLVLNYSLSLLSPATEAQVELNAERRYISGLGFCSATIDEVAREVQASCFKRGAQPALVSAQLDGISASLQSIEMLDFTPAALELLSGKTHEVKLRYDGPTKPVQVRMVAYDVRAHREQRVVAPSLLGRSASECAIR